MGRSVRQVRHAPDPAAQGLLGDRRPVEQRRGEIRPGGLPLPAGGRPVRSGHFRGYDGVRETARNAARFRRHKGGEPPQLRGVQEALQEGARRVRRAGGIRHVADLVAYDEDHRGLQGANDNDALSVVHRGDLLAAELQRHGHAERSEGSLAAPVHDVRTPESGDGGAGVCRQLFRRRHRRLSPAALPGPRPRVPVRYLRRRAVHL